MAIEKLLAEGRRQLGEQKSILWLPVEAEHFFTEVEQQGERLKEALSLLEKLHPSEHFGDCSCDPHQGTEHVKVRAFLAPLTPEKK